MNLLNAIEYVLKSAQKPMHVRVITEKLISGGLWKSSGKTPERTISARLYSDIKEKGDLSVFIKISPQIFALRSLSLEDIHTIIKEPVETSMKEVFSFTNCAHKILEAFGRNEPMHYKEITDKALQRGWLKTSGKTPELTMNAQILTEIKRQNKRGKHTRFVQHGRGYFGLSQWIERGLAFQIDEHNQKVRKVFLEQLLLMKPNEFEELISLLLVEMGFEMVEVTKLSKDGGIDVRGTLLVGDVVCIKMGIQAKKWKNNVTAPVVQQVRGSLGVHEQGLIITTSNFSPGAIKESMQSDKPPIALMNGEQLVTLLMENGIGVHRTTPDLFELDDDFANRR